MASIRLYSLPSVPASFGHIVTTPSSSADYIRAARAIAFLRAHQRQQPSLAMVADHLGLSETHVQKLFSRWTGISPKRFLQFLTVEYAKERMAQTGDLLNLSLDVGLSGPGRLHDLFVNMEAMSPGEFKQAAAGLSIEYGMGQTPFGAALIATTGRGICHLEFVDNGQQDAAIHALKDKWPSACFQQNSDAGQEMLDKLFAPGKDLRDLNLSLWVSGSNFQIQVWRALIRIPFAGMLNYQQLAQLIGKPKAARAVGNAIAQNPIAYLIPCHRVLRQTGDVGKYHWGESRKAAILAWEASHNQAENR